MNDLGFGFSRSLKIKSDVAAELVIELPVLGSSNTLL